MGLFNVAASSECYGDVAAFLRDLQLCCLVLAGRDAVELVVLVMMRCGAVSGGRGGDVWWWSW